MCGCSIRKSRPTWGAYSSSSVSGSSCSTSPTCPMSGKILRASMVRSTSSLLSNMFNTCSSVAASPAVEFEQYGGWQRGATTTTPSFAAAAATCVLTRHLILSNLPELKSNLKCILTRSLKIISQKKGSNLLRIKMLGQREIYIKVSHLFHNLKHVW